MSPRKTNDRKAGLPVTVAITASAVRTRSLELLLERLAGRKDAALVVVLQHREALDEDRFRSAVARAGHDLVEFTDVTPVEAGRLYLPGAGVIATLEEGRLRTRPTARSPGERGVIDSFLVSLAHEAGRRAILVALEGTDGDGTLGVQEVKEAGGLTLAEETEESRAGDLAASNSPAALADAVLPVDDLAARLVSMLEQVEGATGDKAPDEADVAEMAGALATIASVLRGRTGHDFHGYKPGTFLRRVQRRMQVRQVETVEAYIEALRSEPSEAQDLFNDLLIGVTEFFRDKREWERLERDVIPRLFEGKTARDQIRVWVVGCSTGEEAYSIALLLAEHRGRLEDPPQIQVFASDLDGRALAAARAGRYSDSITSQMTPERLGRWFVKEGNTYCVSKELREMCIFSQHSIIRDAPFSRLDLVSCRNLLIYLDAELQEQVIPVFHFALRPGGFLFLGNSENASRHATLFSPLSAQSRIFRRLDRVTPALPVFPFSSVDRRFLMQAANVSRTERLRADPLDVTRRAQRIVERRSPAYVIVDDAQTVLHFSANMGQYIAPAGGAASLDLLQLVHPHLRLDLRAALSRAAEGNQAVEASGLEIETNGRRLAVDVAVEPIQGDGDGPASYVVLFMEAPAGPTARPRLRQAPSRTSTSGGSRTSSAPPRTACRPPSRSSRAPTRS